MKSNRSRLIWLTQGTLAVAALAWLPSVAQAQRVQLPEFSYFGTSTSVLVPDRGSAYMGGIGRSASGQTTSGAPLIPWANRGIGRSAGAGSTSVSAWIHDFQAMDEAVLAEAAGDGSFLEEVEKRNRVHIRRLQPEAAPPDNTLVSAAEHARRQAAKQDDQQAEAQRNFEKAQSLLAAGKPGVARIYLQMALRRAEGPLKAEIAAALAASRGTQVAAETDR